MLNLPILYRFGRNKIVYTPRGFKILLKDLFEYVHQGQIDIALLRSESQTLSKINGRKFEFFKLGL